MAYFELQTLNVATDGSGNGNVSTSTITGKISHIVYTQDGTNPYTSGATLTVSDVNTGQVIWTQALTASATVAPRQPTHTSAGAAALYAAAGTAVNTPFAVASGQVKVAISGGGVTKTGKFQIVYGDAN